MPTWQTRRPRAAWLQSIRLPGLLDYENARMIEASEVTYDDISEYRAPSETLVGKDILLEEVYVRIERAETAELKSEILRALDLRNCLILGLNLDGVVFSHGTLDQPTDLSGAFFAECSLVDSNFCGCRLSSARLCKVRHVEFMVHSGRAKRGNNR